MSKNGPILSHCNGCSRETKHDILHEKTKFSTGEIQGIEVEWSKTNRMLECRGCEGITLQVTWWHSEADLSEDVALFPPRISRKPPVWLADIPDELSEIMSETYSALHANSRRLAMMGPEPL